MENENNSARHAVLLACAQSDLLARIEPAFLLAGVRAQIVLSAHAALDALADRHPRDLAIVDSTLPDMQIGQFLAEARALEDWSRRPIVLIADTVAPEALDYLANGVLDDVILRHTEILYWQLRVDILLRTRRMSSELEMLRETARRNAHFDRLTGTYNRESMLSALFRETDRVQRMGGCLSLVLFDVDDFGHWNSRLGADACDELLCQVVARTTRLLRSYDILGRPGKDEFLIVLPGCTPASAQMLAERLRLEVFSQPFRIRGESIRLSACFGISSSQGRSPVVAMREAEKALARARETGPESIRIFGTSAQEPPTPVTFLSSESGERLLAW